jgi:hypothetical protein
MYLIKYLLLTLSLCLLATALQAQRDDTKATYFAKHRPAKIITGTKILPFPGAVGCKNNIASGDGPGIIWDPGIIQITNDSNFNVATQIRAQQNNVYLVWGGVIDHFTSSSNYGTDWNSKITINGPQPPFMNTGFMAANGERVYYTAPYDSTGTNFHSHVWLRTSLSAGALWDSGQIITQGEPVALSAHNNKLAVVFSRSTIDTVFLMHFATSNDWGKSWQGENITIPGASISIRQTDSMFYILQASDSSNAPGCYVNEVEFYSTSDLSKLWDNHVVLSTPDCATSDEPALDADTIGNVYVVWRDGKYGSITGYGGSLILRHSSDYGVSWGPEQIITAQLTGVVPKISVEGSNVLVAWADENSIGGREIHKAHCRLSTDCGANWSPEYNASDIMPYDWEVDVDCAISDGYLYIAFADTVPNYDFQIFVRRGRVGPTGVNARPNLPLTLSLYPNYPNPFNNTTQLRFTLPMAGKIKLTLTNILGQEVALLTDRFYIAGEYTIPWDASKMSSGIYIASLNDGERILRQKLLLIK